MNTERLTLEQINEKTEAALELLLRQGYVVIADGIRDLRDMALRSVPAEPAGELIETAERYAAKYDGDDRQDIKTDVLNAFYAGSKFSRQSSYDAGAGAEPSELLFAYEAVLTEMRTHARGSRLIKEWVDRLDEARDEAVTKHPWLAAPFDKRASPTPSASAEEMRELLRNASDTLQRIAEYSDHTGADRAFRQVKEMAKATHALLQLPLTGQAQGWIPVSERLPEVSGWQWIHWWDANTLELRTERYGAWSSKAFGNSTHWHAADSLLPLPQAPAKEG